MQQNLLLEHLLLPRCMLILLPVGVLEELRRRLRGPGLEVKLLQSPVSLLQLLQDAVLLRGLLRGLLRRPLTQRQLGAMAGSQGSFWSVVPEFTRSGDFHRGC